MNSVAQDSPIATFESSTLNSTSPPSQKLYKKGTVNASTPSRVIHNMVQSRKTLGPTSSAKQQRNMNLFAPAADPPRAIPIYKESNTFDDDSDLEDAERAAFGAQVPTATTEKEEMNDSLITKANMNSKLPVDITSEGQLKKLEQVNTHLKRENRNKDKEIKALKEQLTDALELRNAEQAAFDPSSTAPKDAKIIELAKKARKLTIALEREKGRSSSLLSQIKKYEQEQQTKAAREEIGLPTLKPGKDKDDPNGTNAKLVKDRLAFSRRKLEEERGVTQSLKTEMRKLQKVLIMEVGEGTDLTKLMNQVDGGSWKGRAEQISLLKEKVKELTRKLSQSSREDQQQDHRQKAPIQKIEASRRLEYEKVSLDLEVLNHEHQELKSKYDAIKARNTILTNEIKNLKHKLEILVKKSENDNRLIEALQARMGATD